MALMGIPVGLIALGSVALLIWSLVVILTTDRVNWKAAQMSQLMWLAVVLVMPLIGSILFVAIGRKQLRSGVPMPQPHEEVAP